MLNYYSKISFKFNLRKINIDHRSSWTSAVGTTTSASSSTYSGSSGAVLVRNKHSAWLAFSLKKS